MTKFSTASIVITTSMSKFNLNPRPQQPRKKCDIFTVFCSIVGKSKCCSGVLGTTTALLRVNWREGRKCSVKVRSKKCFWFRSPPPCELEELMVEIPWDRTLDLNWLEEKGARLKRPSRKPRGRRSTKEKKKAMTSSAFGGLVWSTGIFKAR